MVCLENSLPLTTRLNPRSPLLEGLRVCGPGIKLSDSLRMVLLKLSSNIVFSQVGAICALQRASFPSKSQPATCGFFNQPYSYSLAFRNLHSNNAGTQVRISDVL